MEIVNEIKQKDGKDEKKFVQRSLADIQRAKLEKLMKNPDKPVNIPELAKKDREYAAPSFVRNVMGSSAGAGSGEFHVYRHLRRKEFARQKHLKMESEKERLDEEFQEKLEENQRKADEKTSKKRAKRLKRKMKAKANGKKPKLDANGDKEESEEESEAEDEDTKKSEDEDSNEKTPAEENGTPTATPQNAEDETPEPEAQENQ